MGPDGGVLVPPRRLGNLLHQARVAAGAELEDFATRCDLTVAELDDLERGRRSVDDDLLSRLIETYGVEDAGLVPARAQLVIDLHEGRIAVERRAMPVGTVGGPDAVLARYLALVYRLRELPLGTRMPLREVDLEVLATALVLDPSEVENRLQQLMADEASIERDQHRLRRRILLPLVGVVIAATGVGTLLLVAEDAPAPDPAPAVTQFETGTARVADAAVVDAGAPGLSVADAAVVDRGEVGTRIADPAVVDADSLGAP